MFSRSMQLPNGTIKNNVQPNRNWKIPYGGIQTGNISPMTIYVFEVHLPNGTIKKNVQPNRKWEIQYDRIQTGSTYI